MILAGERILTLKTLQVLVLVCDSLLGELCLSTSAAGKRTTDNYFSKVILAACRILPVIVHSLARVLPRDDHVDLCIEYYHLQSVAEHVACYDVIFYFYSSHCRYIR